VTTRLLGLYDALRDAFGHRDWWPGDSPFEVMVGALLTQNTNWRNVEKAIAALKNADALDPERLVQLPLEDLQTLIRPSGYFRQKSVRLLRLTQWLLERADGRLEALADVPTDELRAELLSLRGIGPETADSILLYAFERPVFVVDTYTMRVAVRHGFVEPECGYDELQYFFSSQLEDDVQMFGDFHGQLVELGKRHCRPKPRCDGCPVLTLLGPPVDLD